MTKNFVIPFKDIRLQDISIVGGKTASIGEMICALQPMGIKVPDGFAITSYAYNYLLQKSGIQDKIWEILFNLDVNNISQLQKSGRKIRELVRKTEFPVELEHAIVSAYKDLSGKYGVSNVDVAVRSSATAEDLPEASFAGQQETYLNVRGEKALIDACKRCFASLFTDRAISYRIDKHFGHYDIFLSIGVQKMVRSDLACAGVAFSIDTESGFKNVVLINASYGLGENVVKGIVNPDEYYVFKPTLKLGKRPIISKHLGTKKTKYVYSDIPDNSLKNVPVPPSEQCKYALSDDEILKLAEWVCMIEDYYSKLRGTFTPMDIEWGKDGDPPIAGTGDLYILQARPETVHSRRNTHTHDTYVLKEKGKILTCGKAIGSKISRGKAHIILHSKKMSEFKKGEILVTDMTDPDWEPIMKIASGIVTNRGGRTCHAAIVARELGIPCIVGTENGTKVIQSGMKITLSCCEGEIGKVYEGYLQFEAHQLNLESLPKTTTKIMMNIGVPNEAFKYSQIPSDGVGLARVEFIIGSSIGIHPLVLLNFNELTSKRYNRTIREIVSAVNKKTVGYVDKSQFFIDKLAWGIATVGAAFYPRDVIVRLSDFKTNEYANLIGGVLYEEKENNPMIGWRGASRYYDPKFKDAFRLECMALRKVREEMGLTNVKVMVPFCRTLEEGRKIIDLMDEYGLKRGDNTLEIYMMVEVPSNVILAEQFADIFDGFSIGSNDLTQLTLGLDRDSELVSHLFDERDPAVLELIKKVIHVAKQKGKKIGICGQAPSDFPEYAEFLVRCGIISISLNPDAVINTTLQIAEVEKKIMSEKSLST